MDKVSRILNGLSEIAEGYDGVICDVWGVLHDGRKPHPNAVEALRRFRAEQGPVVLLSNAPRPIVDMEAQFHAIGVPTDFYDAIVTSGVAAREDLSHRAGQHRLAILHIGPERDRGVFAGLNLDVVAEAECEIALCTGLWDDDTETPDDYAGLLERLRLRNVPMLCANPDIVVQRADKLIYCAGAIAKAYEQRGGQVVWFGKPHRPIYETTLRALSEAAGKAVRKPLAIGDGADTDIKGANGMGIDALFIADGVHAAQLGGLTAEGLAQIFAVPGVYAKAAMPSLTW